MRLRISSCAATVLLICATVASAQTSPTLSMPAVLTRDAAVQFALHNNPILMTVRKQQGYAEAAIIAGKTYPYNPVFTGYVTGTGGPISSAITNRVYLEDYVSLEVELRGQRHHRRAVASATATRIEWEITQQELAATIAVIRAYNTVLYRQAKLQFVDEGLKLTQAQFDALTRAAEAGKAKKSDLVQPRIDLAAARAQWNQPKITLGVARADLRKLLGTLDDSFALSGELEVPLPPTDPEALAHHALEQRPDLHARRAAISEAEAGLRLIVANRYGNPSIGPFFEYDPTRTNYVGGRLSVPLAVFNTKKAEIHKAETDVAKVQSEVMQLELAARQDVNAALARLADAQQWAAGYQKSVVPELAQAKRDLEALYGKNDPAVDLPRVITATRNYLKASESLLDALFERSQAQADLALAIAEPSLALGPGVAAPAPRR